jgi:hypothetical protein
MLVSQLDYIHDNYVAHGLLFELAFAPFAPQGAPAKSFGTLTLQKLAYICCSLLTLAVGLWKCRSMGLLPTGTGDWLAFETRGQVCFQTNSPMHINEPLITIP